jgi:uncharacterized phiE125 gp8 family phage protein
MGALIVTVPPTTFPVSLAEAKKQVEVATAITHHDDHLTRLIKAATAEVESRTGRTILTTTYELHLDDFPSGSNPIILPRPPLQTVASVAYVDGNGDSQTLSTDVYKVITSREPGEIVFKYGQTWPEVYDESDSITITYNGGYGDEEGDLPDVCEWIKEAILILVHAYWLRDHSQPFERFTLAADRIIEAHRVGDDFSY